MAAKKTTPLNDKPTTVTIDGIDITIDPNRMDDWDLLETLYLLQDDPQANVLQVVPFLKRFLGDDTYKKVKDTLRDTETGRLTTTRVSEFLTELFKAIDPNS